MFDSLHELFADGDASSVLLTLLVLVLPSLLLLILTGHRTVVIASKMSRTSRNIHLLLRVLARALLIAIGQFAHFSVLRPLSAPFAAFEVLRVFYNLELPHQRALAAQQNAPKAVNEKRTRNNEPPASMKMQSAKMMETTNVFTKELVLVGGGHAHVHVLKMFGMQPEPGVRVTLISVDVETIYSGMLPGLVSGVYTSSECHIDLMRLSQFANARFIQDQVVGVDLNNKLVILKNTGSVAYHVLSINVGITPRVMRDVHGIIPVKPVSTFSTSWESILQRASKRLSIKLGVVGGGAGGVELILAMKRRLCKMGIPNVEGFLFSKASGLLYGHNERVVRAAEATLIREGVRIVHDEVHQVDCAPDGTRVVTTKVRVFVRKVFLGNIGLMRLIAHSNTPY